jgi:putative spermidine/putrescine transport system permease protein
MTYKRRQGWFFGACLAAAWMVLTFLVMPTLVVVPVSLTDQSFLALPREGLSFQYYRNLVTSEVWYEAAGQSLLVAASSTIIIIVVGTLCSIGCWRIATRSSELALAFMLTPLMVPSIVNALGFYRVWIDLGLLDTFIGVVIVDVVTGLPYLIITVSTSLANFDSRLELAARGLGASPTQIVWRVIVPCIVPGILSGSIFAFIHCWDEIVVLLFITSRKLYLLPRALWDALNWGSDPTIAAIATILMLFTLVALVVEQSLRRRAPRRDIRSEPDVSPSI